MTHTYNISGMTCGSCVARVKNQLLMLGDITEAEVGLTSPQATITMQKHLSLSKLQEAVSKAGPYIITEAADVAHSSMNMEDRRSWLSTYKPVLLIGIYLLVITLSIQFAGSSFNWEMWMRHFMAGFFLAFSFFKMLDLEGFADSYSTYDIIARRWHGWGFVYAFLELGLGLAFLLHFNPLVTNAVAFIIMGISIVGVLQSVMNKRKIRCACLGAVFNLPMSTVTIIEDALMIAMSGIMMITML